MTTSGSGAVKSRPVWLSSQKEGASMYDCLGNLAYTHTPEGFCVADIYEGRWWNKTTGQWGRIEWREDGPHFVAQ